MIFFADNIENLMMDFFLDDVPKEKMIKLQDSLQQSGAAPGGKIERIFTAIEASLSTDLVSKTGAIYQFNVKGKNCFITNFENIKFIVFQNWF